MSTQSLHPLRSQEFQRNPALESLLAEINGALAPAEIPLLPAHPPRWPLIFVVGPLRSGTTLLMQWLSQSGLAQVPSNLISRFYAAPVLGAKIQLLLTDARFQFRDELSDIVAPTDFSSNNGKTRGALSPNEFWYFWRRFIPDDAMTHQAGQQLAACVDTRLLVAELAGLTEIFQAPFALKAMLLNYCLDFLDNLFDKAIFLHVQRDPLANMASILDARRRQYGSDSTWYSFQIPEYEILKGRSPVEQAAGQVFCANRAIHAGLATIAEHKKVAVSYEEFCVSPEALYHKLRALLQEQGHEAAPVYTGPARFGVTRSREAPENLAAAWQCINDLFRHESGQR